VLSTPLLRREGATHAWVLELKSELDAMKA
jgi:hypothetical protein